VKEFYKKGIGMKDKIELLERIIENGEMLMAEAFVKCQDSLVDRLKKENKLLKETISILEKAENKK
jgi:hypothetical protein